MHTYSRVPGLGKQRGKKENSEYEKSTEYGGVQREALSGNIVTQKKNYGKAAGNL